MMPPDWKITRGDCIATLRTLADASADAIICDPPYEIGFMSRGWDNSGIAYSVELWREALRVAKPGAHLLAFGAPRTYHRLAVAIEDAGWEIRDSIHWIFGSGFPKSKNVALSIDKGEGHPNRGRAIPTASTHLPGGRYADEALTSNAVPPYEPRTDEARAWDGWGTALKPAHEPIVLARKPLTGTVAENVLTHGTGALNIDATRVPGALDGDPNRFAKTDGGSFAAFNTAPVARAEGRWPANVILSHAEGCAPGACAAECPCAAMDAQSGIRPGGAFPAQQKGSPGSGLTMGGGWTGAIAPPREMGDSGGASRFFNRFDAEPCFYYTAKASTAEREAGLEGRERRTVTDGRTTPADNPRQRGKTERANIHPTVKPIGIMRHLVRLAAPKGALVIDPFAGSGTTGIAAVLEGVRFHGIELDETHADIAEARIAYHARAIEEAARKAAEGAARAAARAADREAREAARKAAKEARSAARDVPAVPAADPRQVSLFGSEVDE